MDVILYVYVGFSSIVLFMRENTKILPFLPLAWMGLEGVCRSWSYVGSNT